MKFTYSPEFEAELLVIGEYMERNEFDLGILSNIRDKIVEMLAAFPEIGEIYDGDVRKIVVLRKNMVYYRVQHDQIHVLHIKSGFQDKRIEK